MTEDVRAIYPSLKDLPVVVTGGASGIGEAIVRRFAAQAARVGFLDIAGSEGQRLAAELSDAGLTVAFRHCDVTNAEALAETIEALRSIHGPALVLVNNAAHDERHDWRDVTPAYWDERMAVNLRHHFFAIQAVAPGMIAAGRGAIINLGSIGWMIAGEDYPIYAGAKAAVHGLTRSFARALGQHGIRVNTVQPGWVMTERQLKLWVDEAAEQAISEGQALKGRLSPDDIAAMVLFLASDEGAMCSAQSFIVDGGWA